MRYLVIRTLEYLRCCLQLYRYADSKCRLYRSYYWSLRELELVSFLSNYQSILCWILLVQLEADSLRLLLSYLRWWYPALHGFLRRKRLSIYCCRRFFVLRNQA